jgi:hypothetical protein
MAHATHFDDTGKRPGFANGDRARPRSSSQPTKTRAAEAREREARERQDRELEQDNGRYDSVDRRLMDTFPASDAVARY